MRIGKPKGSPIPTRNRNTRNKRSAPRKPVYTDLDISLPEQMEGPITDLGEAVITFHGETKIGKSQTASKFPESLMLFCEPGGSGMTAYKKNITSWAQFEGVVHSLEQTDRYKTVVIDTADFLYNYCFRHVCGIHDVKHPSEKGYGQVWDDIKGTFKNTLDILLKQPRGVIFISHTKSGEFQERMGNTYNKLIATMANQARDYIGAVVDLTAYFGYYGTSRYITVEGSDSLDCGHRLEYAFWVKGKTPILPKGFAPRGYVGKVPLDEAVRVHSIPMGKNAETSYRNLVKAFRNEQLKTYEPDLNPFIETRKRIERGR